MPNIVDLDRLGTTLGDAKIVNLDEYRAQAEIKRSTSQGATTSKVAYVGVTTWVMIVVVFLFVVFGFRR